MNNEFDDIKNQWKEARKNNPGKPKDAMQIIEQAQSKKKSTLYHQYGNIGVLTAVVIMIVFCFYYFFPFQELLSRTGVVLMVGGLIVRIAVEIFSTIKSKQIDLADPAVKTSSKTLEYYNFRKTVNGIVTISLVITYVVGFAMLTPEFLKYIDAGWMALYDSLFVISGIVLIWQIRKGIRQEMKNLEDIVKLHEELSNSE